MEAILSRFSLQGRPLTCERYGQGHINLTYLVTTDSGRRYILQRLSRAAFHDIPALMRNVAAVTGFLAARSTDPRQTLHLIPTRDGENWVRDEAGEAWRVYDYVEDSICLQVPESPEDLYESAIAFGSFQRMLADFPAETLHETIPNFHNTPDRYRIFRETLAADPMGRAAGIQREIDFVLAREEEAGALQRMRESGELPLRVTHNDTKLNNVMLDCRTRKALCVIDLDTVMPGLVAFDFGDSIRFGASTGPEDERDLDRIWLDLSGGLHPGLRHPHAPGDRNAAPGREGDDPGVRPQVPYRLPGRRPLFRHLPPVAQPGPGAYPVQAGGGYGAPVVRDLRHNKGLSSLMAEYETAVAFTTAVFVC